MTSWIEEMTPSSTSSRPMGATRAMPRRARCRAERDAAPSAGLTWVASNVGAITTYGNALYANVFGQVYASPASSTCAAPTLYVPHDASQNTFRGIAVNDGGIYWTADDGIWLASFDANVGSKPAITDTNNPQVLAVDGTRLSWTTADDAGASVINSCRAAKSGCAFTGTIGTSGSGGPSQLVGATANLKNDELAATPGFIAWIVGSMSNQVLMFTPVDGGASTPVQPMDDKSFASTSDRSLVSSDGPTIFWSFWNNGNNALVVRRSVFPGDTSGALVVSVSGGVGGKALCLGAGAGLLGYARNNNELDFVDPLDAGANAFTIVLGDADTPSAVAITSSSIFVLTGSHQLYCVPR